MIASSTTKHFFILILTLSITSCAESGLTSNSTQGTTSESNHNEAAEVEMVVNFSPEQAAHIKDLIKNYQKSGDEIDPERIFRQRCAICHGVKGNLGVNGAGDLTKSNLNLNDRVATIYYGKKTMTPFKEISKRCRDRRIGFICCPPASTIITCLPQVVMHMLAKQSRYWVV